MFLVLGAGFMFMSFMSSGENDRETSSQLESTAVGSTDALAEVESVGEELSSSQVSRSDASSIENSDDFEKGESQPAESSDDFRETPSNEVPPSHAEDRDSSSEEALVRTVRRHFSNLAIDTDDSWMSAFMDFSKRWRLSNSFQEFSVSRGGWFLKDGWQNSILQVEILEEGRLAAVEIDPSYFTTSGDLQRLYFVFEDGSWKIDNISSRFKDTGSQPGGLEGFKDQIRQWRDSE